MVARNSGLSLRVSLTDRCQLRCQYCLPAEGSAADDSGLLSVDEIVRFVRSMSDSFGLTKVHLAGGEPLLRTDIVELFERLHGLALPDVALTTNGQLLSGLAGPLWRAGLRRVNVSLDSIVPETFLKMTRGGLLKQTLDGIQRALSYGMLVKINTVVIRGQNDGEICRLVDWAMGLGCDIRFLEMMPIGPARDAYSQWHYSADAILQRLGEKYEVSPISLPGGGTTRWFGVSRKAIAGTADLPQPDATGSTDCRVGLIASMSHPFCHACNRMRLTSSGQLVGCLAIGRQIDIRHLLRDDGDVDLNMQQLILKVTDALSCKRHSSDFDTEHLMTQTGG